MELKKKIGIAYLKYSKLDSAAIILEEVLQDCKDNNWETPYNRTWDNLGVIQKQRGNFDSAKMHFEKVLSYYT